MCAGPLRGHSARVPALLPRAACARAACGRSTARRSSSRIPSTPGSSASSTGFPSGGALPGAAGPVAFHSTRWDRSSAWRTCSSSSTAGGPRRAPSWRPAPSRSWKPRRCAAGSWRVGARPWSSPPPATPPAPFTTPARATTCPRCSSSRAAACRCSGARAARGRTRAPGRPRRRRRLRGCHRAGQRDRRPPTGYYPEGGARNAARRDGMGTTVLAAVEAAGEIPDHYFQAVGSGTGRHRRLGDEPEAAGGRALRRREDEAAPRAERAFHPDDRRLGSGLPHAGRGAVPEAARAVPRHPRAGPGQQEPARTRSPAGCSTRFSDTGGLMYRVTNAEARSRRAGCSRSCEGCDIDPAAEVAVASLLQAVARRTDRPAGRRGAEHHRRRAAAGCGATGASRSLRPHATFTLDAAAHGRRRARPALLRAGPFA